MLTNASEPTLIHAVFFRLALLAIATVVVTSLPFVSTADSAERESTFVIGRITDKPDEHYAPLENMGTFLLPHLKDLGYQRVELAITRDLDAMVRLFREGKVDMLSETAFATVRLRDDANAEPLLREWKKGVAEYHSVFFTRKDSAIKTLDDLKGKKVAFEDAGSTSAFIVPSAILRQSGMRLVELENIDQEPPADRVGYAFANDEMTQLIWVARGIADIGAFSNLDWEKQQGNSMVTDRLTVMHKGAPILRSVLMVRAGLPVAVKNRLEDTLLAMANDATGARTLAIYNKVKKYDRMNDTDMRQSLEHVRRLSKALQTAEP